MRGLPAQQRKNLILDHAQRLFVEKGYRATTITDIVNRSGIAKGTLYHHFASKDDVMRQLIRRTTDQLCAQAEAVAQSTLDPVDKLLGFITSLRLQGDQQHMVEVLHSTHNIEFHVLSMTEAIDVLAPILATIIEQGVREQVFSTPQPLEDSETILTAAFVLPDQALFAQHGPEVIQRRLLGVVNAAERLLGCAPGTLSTALAHNAKDAGDV